jgi:chromosome segregation ATPase
LPSFGDPKNYSNRLEENYEQKVQQVMDLEARYNEQVDEKVIMESDQRKLRHHSEELEKEKEELIKQVDRHNMYIDELTECIKDREKNLNEALKFKKQLEYDLDGLTVDNHKLKTDSAKHKENLDFLKHKCDKDGENIEILEFEIAKKEKQLDSCEEDRKAYKKKYEESQRDYDVLQTENLNLKKHIVDDEHTNNQLRDRIENHQNEYKEVQGKYTQARHELEILRHKFEKASMTHQEIQDELRRFNF